jgi:hypothetical protein
MSTAEELVQRLQALARPLRIDEGGHLYREEDGFYIMDGKLDRICCEMAKEIVRFEASLSAGYQPALNISHSSRSSGVMFFSHSVGPVSHVQYQRRNFIIRPPVNI